MRELEKNYSKEKAKASALEKELEIVKVNWAENHCVFNCAR